MTRATHDGVPDREYDECWNGEPMPKPAPLTDQDLEAIATRVARPRPGRGGGARTSSGPSTSDAPARGGCTACWGGTTGRPAPDGYLRRVAAGRPRRGRVRLQARDAAALVPDQGQHP